MNKKGVSHIEIILAFVLFIFSLLLGLAFLNPVRTDTGAQDTQDMMYNAVKRNITGTIDTYNLIINSPIQNESIAIVVPARPNGNVRVENISGSVLNSTRAGQDVYFDWKSENGRFIKVYLGNFSASSAATSRPAHNESLYNVSSVLSEPVISEERARYLSLFYEQEYTVLHRNLGMPSARSFDFELSFGPGISIAGERQSPERSVYVRTERVEVLRTDGSRTFGELQVRTW